MRETFRGTRTLRYIWNEQHGLCTICKLLITRTTGWRLHHCVPLVRGGLRVPKTAFYFIQSAMTRFTARIFLYQSRVSLKEEFEGFEPCDRETITHGS